MINKANVRLRFSATDEITQLLSAKVGILHWTDGVVQVLKGDIAAGLLAGWPDNFRVVTEIADKAAVRPVANKAMPAPQNTKAESPKPSVADVQTIFDAARHAGVIELSRPYYKFKGLRLGKGKAAAIEFLSNNSSVLADIKAAI